MDFVENEVRMIIQAEQAGAPWADIVSMSERLIKYIVDNNLVSDVDADIYQYLEDHDVRIEDEVYAKSQITTIIDKLANPR